MTDIHVPPDDAAPPRAAPNESSPPQRPRVPGEPRVSRIAWLLIALILVAGAVSLHIYYRLYRVAPAPQFESAEDHFLHGSIGTEEQRGIPYWIWLVLPRVFPEYLPAPGGYASIGIMPRAGYEMPVGLTKVDIGVPRVGVNCAFCHTATVRATPSDAPAFYPGAPAHQTGAQEYRRFLAAAAADPRFTAGNILDEISRNVRLPLTDRLLYRFILIPQTRRALRRLADEEQATKGSAWGRGRTDMVNRATLTLLQRPAGSAIGTAESMPLWQLQSRERHGYLWDRSNTSLPEVVRAWALVEGASAKWMDGDAEMWERSGGRESSGLRRVAEYLGDLQPPKYPFAMDATLAQAGANTYAAECAHCHDANGARANSPIPLAEIGTDGSRLDAWTAESAAAFNEVGAGHRWKFSSSRPATQGYVAPSLAGVWLNAPYLHNGSVPTLRDMLQPPADRPARFWRGYDVYDQAAVGFVSDGAEASRAGTLHDVAQPGNGNGGHTYGTALTEGEKRALLEYLKTL